MALGNAGDCIGYGCEYYGQLIKLNSEGDVVYGFARETSDGGFIAAGYYECISSMDCYPDMFILKTDSDGNVEWFKVEGSD